jgi:hypothetical protein
LGDVAEVEDGVVVADHVAAGPDDPGGLNIGKSRTTTVAAVDTQTPSSAADFGCRIGCTRAVHAGQTGRIKREFTIN